MPAGHIYNVYINTVDKELCDKNNYLHYVILDTTQLTGDINYKMNYYLLYNNFWDYLQCNISFLNGLNEDIRPSYTCRSKTLDSSVTYRYKMVIDSDDFPNGYNLGKIKGDSIDNDSICVDTKKTNLPDIDVYNSSPIAQNGDIDITPDIINSIVNEGKSIDDVLGALNYEGEGESILDQLTVGDKSTENNKNDTDVSNDTDKTTDVTDENIKDNNQSQTEEKIRIFKKIKTTIFRPAHGHLKEDTPENRKIFEDVANDPSNNVSEKYSTNAWNNDYATDKYGNEWYSKINEKGEQIWVKVRGKYIINAGINGVGELRTYDKDTGFDKPQKERKSKIKLKKNSTRNFKKVGESMILNEVQVYNAIIEYLTEYNKQIGNNDDINKTIDMVTKLKVNNNMDTDYLVDEQDALIDMYDLLKDYYDNTKLDEIGALLGDIVLFEDGSTSDPAAWEDWMKAVNKVTKNNVDTDSTSNSGDASSIPLTTGIVGAIGSIISRKRKK